jgi:parallel beta-helix repeat protein
MSGNAATANKEVGIGLSYSSNNTVLRNNITNNYCGIGLGYSTSNNMIYHNNFINNSQQMSSLEEVMNTWDDGYPSSGNYWSNYTGSDYYHGPNQDLIGNDGIGDTAYVINVNDMDHYPLMGPFKTFNAGTWNNTSYNVDMVSKSNITDFNFNPYATPHPALSFDVEGTNGTIGFCRIVIPRDMMWCANSADWVITVGGNLTAADSIVEDGNYTYIYFTYTHSTKTVQIQSTHAVPEFQPFLILPLLIIVTLLAVVARKRKHAH